METETFFKWTAKDPVVKIQKLQVKLTEKKTTEDHIPK